MNTKFAEKVFRAVFSFVFVVGTVWVPTTSVGASPALAVGNGLHAEYRNLGGTEIILTVDGEGPINHGWNGSCPGTDMYQDVCGSWAGTFNSWSLLEETLTGYIEAPSTGTYEFHSWIDDYLQITINGTTQTADDIGGAGYSIVIDLVEGQFYPITMNFKNRMGSANVSLFWTLPDSTFEAVPKQYLYTEMPNPPSTCLTPPSGLISWWPGNGMTQDIVSGHDAELRNGATYGTGFVGQAFSLDGIDDFVNVADDPALSFGTSDFTVDFWVNFNTTAGEQILIEKYIETENEGTRTGWTLARMSDNAIRLHLGSGGGVLDSPPQTIPDNIWIHFALRRNGDVFSIFMNGVEIALGSHSVNVDSTSSLKFGHRGNPDDTPGSVDGRGFYLNGRIDEVSIYDRALTPTEITSIFNTGNAGKCDSGAPVARSDLYTTNEGVVLDVVAPGVLTNDTDSNLDPLTAVKVADPANGMLTLNSKGSFTYTPNTGFTGDDTFTYQANEGLLSSNVATVTIDVTSVNKIGLVTDTNGTNDMSFNWMAYQGLLQAETEFGIDGTLYESTSDADYIPLLQQCADDGNSLCFAVSFLMTDAVATAANANPGKKFAILDVSPNSPPANLRGIQFDEKQVGYLAGALAGKMTASNVIGAVGGMEIPPVVAFVEGYHNGAQCANSNANVLINYTGSFDDYDLGVTTAQDMISQGADALFGVGGLNGNGAIIYGTQHGTWGVGVDTDQYVSLFNNGSVSGSDKMLTSAMKKLDFAVKQTISDYLSGSFSSGTVTYHLADGGVGLAPYHETDASISPETKSYVDGVKAGIISGGINIDETCRVPNPWLEIWYPEDRVQVVDWPLNTTVSLTIDDDFDVNNGVLYENTYDRGNDDRIYVELNGIFDIQPGQVITVSDPQYTRFHQVTNLRVTGWNLDQDTVFGTAEPNSSLQIHAKNADTDWVWRSTVTDGFGNWVFDFSQPGANPNEQDLLDIKFGTGGAANQGGLLPGDGGQTHYAFYIPNPYFEVRYDGDSISGWEWQPNAEVNISVDGVSIATAQTDGGGSFGIGVSEMVDLVPGSAVEVTDGVNTKAHIVTPLSITSVDVDTDIVSGTATPDGRIKVWACGPDGCIDRWETVDGAGNWSADFSVPGDEAGEEQTINIVPGTGLDSQEWDEDGDYTIAGFGVPNPRFVVFPEGEWFDGLDWPDGATVTITVDGKPECDLARISSGGFFNGNFPEGCDVAIDDMVTFADGTTTRTHVVRNLAITAVDAEADTVAGRADAGADVYVWPHATGEQLQVTADSGGTWQADFTGRFDLVPGEGGRSEIRDDVGNATAVDWSVPNPRFEVRYDGDSISGWEWPPNAEVSISVDGASITIAQTDGGGSFGIGVSEMVDLVPGSAVEVTDGVSTKAHIVTNLSITNVDVDTDIVSGTATPNSRIQAWTCWPDNCANRWEMASGAGNWSADFSSPGDEEGEEQTFDIVPGTGLDSGEWDEDGDNTVAGFNVPNPNFSARLTENEVHGYGWPLGASVILNINDPDTPQPVDYIDTQTVVVADWDPNQTFVPFRLWENGFSLEPGMTVSMSEGQITKSHVVTNLTVTAVDHVADTVSGTAAPGSLIEVGHIYCDEIGCYGFRRVNADTNGDWVADFAQVGEDADEQDLIDIVPGMGNEARQPDADGDTTNVQWRVPNPRFDAWFREGSINAYDWPLGTLLTLDMEDPNTPQSPDYSTTTAVGVADWDPNETLGQFNLNGAFEIQPGMTLSVSGASFTKELVVSNLTITNIDLDTDGITGGTEPNQALWMNYNSSSGTCCRNFPADGNGIWTVDYSQPGPNGEPVEDIRPGSSGTINAIDEDGDDTSLNWNVSNPNFSARLTDNEVHGYEWPLGASVTLAIDDPNTPQPVDYTDAQTVIVADWDPNQTFVPFRLWENGFSLGPGMTVSMSEGQITKSHVVTDLTVTVVDADVDTVSGTAAPGSLVEVGHIYCDETGCYGFRRVNADMSGNWMADFANVGEDTDEQDIVDIKPGMGSEARQCDEDGECTAFGWYVPSLFVEAAPYTGWIHARGWPLGTLITLEIDDPSDGTGDVDYTATDTIHQGNPGDPNDILADFNWPSQFVPGPGYIITASGNGQSKTLTVSQLAVTDFDPQADTISGTGSTGVQIQVCANIPNRCITRFVIPDGSGSWTANYAVPGVSPDDPDTVDLLPGSNGWAAEREADGDLTWDDWRVPNPFIEASPGSHWIHAREWPMDAVLSLTIDDPNTPQPVDYTDTAVVEHNPNNPGDPNDVVAFFDLNGVFDLEAGHEIEISGGGTTKTYTVQLLEVTTFDLASDTISGMGVVGHDLQVCANMPGYCVSRYVTVNGDGSWTANYQVPGVQPDEPETVNLQIGSNGWVADRDEDGDQTWYDWRVPNPRFVAQLERNGVYGWEWTRNGQVTITIGGTEVATAPTDQWGNFNLNLTGLDPFVSGLEFVATDGFTTKTLTTADLRIMGVDPETDTVSGLAPIGQTFRVWVHGQNAPNIQVTADASGQWTADFSGQWDIVPATDGAAQIDDADGDGTWVSWRVPHPRFEVRYDQDSIAGWEWPPSTELSITVNDTPLTSVQTNQGGNFSIDVAEMRDLGPGDVVDVTDGVSTKHLIVSTVNITGVNVDTEIVSGTASPDARIQAWVCWPWGCAFRWETGDSAGNWEANFATPGNEPGEEQTANISPGSGVDAGQWDEDGDNTAINWFVPNPRFDAWFREGNVNAYDWPLGTQLILEVEDPNTPESPDFSMETEVGVAEWDPSQTLGRFNLNGAFEIQPGMTLTISGASTTRQLVVSNLTVTSIDEETDIISGTAEPNQMMWMNYHNLPGNCCRNFQADGDGNWSVDYSQPGPNGEPVVDIGPGSSGTINAGDEDGDNTSLNWRLLIPNISVHPDDDWLEGYDWPADTTVSISIDDPATQTNPDLLSSAITGTSDWNPSENYFSLDLRDVFDIQPGFEVSVTDGTTTKQHVVTNLVVTSVDAITNTISGTSDPDVNLQVDIWGTNDIQINIQTDSNGNWTADLAGQYDLQSGDDGRVQEFDSDGDSTGDDWRIPHPVFMLNVSNDSSWQGLDAWNWPLGSQVTLTVDDPGTPQNPDYTEVQTMAEPSDGHTSHAMYMQNNEFEGHPGFTITLSDGIQSKSMIVPLLQGTEYDLEADTVSGVTDPFASVVVACDVGAEPTVTADSNGNWMANFRDPQDPNIVLYDIRPGTWCEPQMYDDDNDHIVLRNWTVPNYMLHAVPAVPEIHGHDWPPNADVTLTIDDDTDPNNGILYTQTRNVNDDPWCGEPCFDLRGVFTLEVGQYASMTDGDVTKTVQVSVLQVTEVDREADTVSGTADPGSRVAVHIWSQAGLARYVTTDSNGNWVADFSVFGDEDSEQFTADIADQDHGSALQLTPDATDDGTKAYWGSVACYTLTTSVNPAGGGSISADPAPNCPTDAGKYEAGTGITLTANYGTNWTFSGWSGGGCLGAGTCTITITADTSVTANFVEVPILISPSDVLTDWNNTFHWTGILSADYYQIEVYDASDVQVYSQWYTNSICTDLACAVSPVETQHLANGDYKWMVRTYGPTGFGNWTAFTDFTLDVAGVTLVSPSDILTTWDNTLRWTGISGADYYQVEVYDASDVVVYSQWYTNSICTDLNCAVHPAETRNLANGDYKWRVRTYSLTGFGEWTAFTDFTLDVAGVMLVSPSDILTTWDNTFSWTGIPSADYYQIEAYGANDALVYSQWYTNGICTGLACAVSPAETQNLANGDYKWRVRTYSLTGFGEWTAFLNFTLDVAGVMLVSPSDILTTWDNTFSWTGIPSADYYQIEVYDASDALVYSQWFTNGICTGLACAVSPAETQNLANGDYKWKVRTYGLTGFGDWTAFTDFTLDVAGVNLVAPTGALNTWNNTFSWTGVSTADYYQMEVHDASDALVYSQWYTNGICTVLACAVSPTETQNLANGDYKWKVRTYGLTGFGPWTDLMDFTLNP